MLGMPEWMSGGPHEQAGNSAAWTAGEEGYGHSGYRFINGSPNCGIVATLLLMGGREEVNQEAYFRYHIERYYPREKPSGNAPFNANANGIQPFVRDMWEACLSP